MINKKGKKVVMDIYLKPTDSKRHPSFKSNNPKHCLKNIPFSLARRICMITEKYPLRGINLKELETLLIEQHYPKKSYKSNYKKSFKNNPKRIKKCKRTRKKRKSYLLFQLIIQTTSKPSLLLNKPWKT